LTPKRREPLILFLDDGFDSPESHTKLTAAGFTVERFRTHFHRDGRKMEGVADPSIIAFCSERKWLLVTLDYNVEYTHTEEIKSSEVAILATANNNHGVGIWVDSIISARADIERLFRKQGRPYVSRISRDGNITKALTISPGRTTRRNRPHEKLAKEITVRAPLPKA
jgi:hypothetical protein